MRRLLVAFLAGALAIGVAAPGGRAADHTATVAVYGGLGSWLDIFAGDVWGRPHAVAAALRANGVRTLYLQTSNYSQTADIVRPAALAALIEAAHAARIRVVGWYLPSFTDPGTDARRALAAIRFRTPDGQRFDSFALDIEASLEHRVGVRNARLLALSRLLRRFAPAGYPLGAIVPSPVGMRHHPHYWPGFPFSQLARWYDAILPMAYFTHYTRTPRGAHEYARDVVAAVRKQTGRPHVVIHLIGGIAADAPDRTFAAFDRAASECGVDGLSLYAFQLTLPGEWSALRQATLGDPQPRCG